MARTWWAFLAGRLPPSSFRSTGSKPLKGRTMNTRIAIQLAGLCLLLTVLVSGASGQQRTFVSGLGSDGNPCTRQAPCRTFTQAISQTTAGGEVVVLDSSGYGAFTIAKSVAIIA